MRNRLAGSLQRLVDPRRPVDATVVVVDRQNQAFEPGVLEITGGFVAVQPCVEAAVRDLQSPAHRPDSKRLAMIADEAEPHFFSFAK
jgi:hypothetical protein